MIHRAWSEQAGGEKLCREVGEYQGASRRVAMRVLCCCNPSWSPGHVVLGQCYYLLGQVEQAEQSLETAKQLDPQTDLFKAIYGTAQLLLEEKQYERAIAPLEEAVRLAPDAQARSTSFRLAYAYVMAERHDRARQSLELWQERYGADADSSYYLALACQRQDDYPCALANLRHALQTGDAGDRKRKIVKYLAKWSNHWALLPQNEARRDELIGQALEETRAWHESDPADAVALRYYVETLLAAGRGREAIEVLRPMAQDEAGNCAVRTLLAAAFNALGDGREAQGWATQAADCDPTDAGAQIELAVSHIHQLHPEYTELPQVQEDQRRIDAALTALRQAVKRGDARAAALLADAQKTLEHLERVEAEFIDRDNAHRIEIRAATAREIRERCQSVHWTKQHDPQRLSAEDKAFYAEHDCRQYLR
jgi:tetratricopeptide (TPR) repeat protein